ncbi:DNA-binding transcriptional regulator [Azospirillum sp. RWY-5-1]|uniref:DNA-binding transcriptional regulator n=1 Tax=Azospirillum oleiclasticum TaxID=2735135 RepID=A0ABX2TA30_9PROT|nr:DNA-binding transcriptional regulator [Azospirillum oleiclasticum]NYZ13831.1 DNA-binding transcriptional regulator [Azospirillum oleiclasticum]NYZ21103.1 DNA-binding transcriptional regulator [Azospirillum oleiclasticum]
MSAARVGPYRHIQGLSRGLAILRTLSRSPNGFASIAELGVATGLHRTTVRRMLATLEQEGYVRRSASDDTYRLNLKIRELSDGFTDDEWISELAAPVLGELLQKVVWPSDLCTLDGTAMLVRETTHRYSPLSFHRAMIRQRMPVLYTASGRAYLAHCGEEERQQILRLLIVEGGEQAGLARNRILVDKVLNRVHEQGYASNDGEWSQQVKVSALALPVRHRGGVLATINIVFMKSVMSVGEAADRYLGHLTAAIAKIEAQIDENPTLLAGART